MYALCCMPPKVGRPLPSGRPAPSPMHTMVLTVDAAAVTALRQLIVRACGEALDFMRIEACDHGRRMRVWLRVRPSSVDSVTDAIAGALPGADMARCPAAARRDAAWHAAPRTRHATDRRGLAARLPVLIPVRPL